MIHIEIESKDSKLLKLLEYLRLLPGVSIYEDEENTVNEKDYPYSKNTPNELTKKSLEDCHQRKGTPAKDVKDLMKKLKS